MLIAIVILGGLGLLMGWLLGFASARLAVEENPVEVEIQAMLPGSQCGQCGYVGCGQAAAGALDPARRPGGANRHRHGH